MKLILFTAAITLFSTPVRAENFPQLFEMTSYVCEAPRSLKGFMFVGHNDEEVTMQQVVVQKDSDTKCFHDATNRGSIINNKHEKEIAIQTCNDLVDETAEIFPDSSMVVSCTFSEHF
ncbi:hypothetical protein AU106_gp001 [Sinorhizobium phage phiM9]|uniref:Uncharacterized protein n=1 Tax=Sinorhizobium phage phiM9 TaxID=1636182 RepID=A0A0F6R4U0_9CAUD|nr:hypothetical protein AU106_gp001 [Sinorhizobium phage phiM9]AKE44632.1 hypothetical protein Sm_phiM9_001 [Sinorhizobium phage phiM9]